MYKPECFGGSKSWKKNILFSRSYYHGIIHLVGSQNFPKNYRCLTPDTYTYVCITGIRNVGFSEIFTNVLNE